MWRVIEVIRDTSSLYLMLYAYLYLIVLWFDLSPRLIHLMIKGIGDEVAIEYGLGLFTMYRFTFMYVYGASRCGDVVEDTL